MSALVQYPPLFTVTPLDKSGTIAIATGQCLVTAFVAVLIRAYVLVRTRGFQLNWDDSVILISLFFAVVQTSLVQKEARIGLGRTIQDISSTDAESIQRYLFADDIFFILSVWASKLSSLLFLIRLTPRRSDHRLAYGSMGLLGVTAIAAILITSLVCELSHPWEYFKGATITCNSPYSRWVAVATFDVVTEVVIALSAMRIIWSLQLQFSRKFFVAGAFLQRLAIIAPIIARLHYLSISYHSKDPTLNATNSTICKEVELSFAIVATSVPCLRPMLSAFATNYGAPAAGPKSHYARDTGAAGSNTVRSNRTGESFALQKLKLKQTLASATSSSSKNRSSTKDHFSSRGGNQFFVSAGKSATQDESSLRSGHSQDMIIRKDVDYDVQYYDKDMEEGDTERSGSTVNARVA